METLIIFAVVVTVMLAFARAAGNPLEHSWRFRRRRIMNWLPLGLTYAFLYFGRYNLTMAKNALGDAMPIEAFGIIFGVGTVVYGVSFLLNGPLTDRMGGKKAILIGAFGAAVMNAVLGFIVYTFLNNPETEMNLTLIFSIVYALNMYFQSFGAVAIVKVNSNWFHVRERGGIGGIFGVLISLGVYFAFDWSKAVIDATTLKDAGDLGIFQGVLRNMLITENTTMNETWWAFWVPAVVLFIAGIVSLFMVKDTPGKAGLKDIRTGDASDSDKDDGPVQFGPLLKRILTNKIVLTVAAIEFCSGVLRQGIMHWYPIYNKQLGLDETFFFTEHWGLLLAIAGASGGMIAGFLSDKVFGSRRGPVAALLYGVMIVVIASMWFTLEQSFILGSTVVLASLAVIGVHGMLSGTATMDFGGRKAAGTAVGVIDGFVYLGTGLQSFALGALNTQFTYTNQVTAKVAKAMGEPLTGAAASGDWSYWPIFMFPFTIIGFLFALKIWKAIPDAAKKRAKAPASASAPAEA